MYVYLGGDDRQWIGHDPDYAYVQDVADVCKCDQHFWTEKSRVFGVRRVIDRVGSRHATTVFESEIRLSERETRFFPNYLVRNVEERDRRRQYRALFVNRKLSGRRTGTGVNKNEKKCTRLSR